MHLVRMRHLGLQSGHFHVRGMLVWKADSCRALLANKQAALGVSFAYEGLCENFIANDIGGSIFTNALYTVPGKLLQIIEGNVALLHFSQLLLECFIDNFGRLVDETIS